MEQWLWCPRMGKRSNEIGGSVNTITIENADCVAK